MNTISNKQSSQWDILFLLSLAYIAASLSMQGFLALMPFLKEEFFLSRTQAGLYTTFYYFTATLTAVFSGRIVDLIGSKKGLVFGSTMVGTVYVLHALSPGYGFILFLGLVGGIGFSIITPSLSKGVMQHMPPERRAVSMGIVQSGSGIGGFVGASLLPILGAIIGWRNALLIAGLLAVVIGINIVYFYKEDNNNAKINKEGMPGFTQSIKLLLKNRDLMFVCLIGMAFGTSIGCIPVYYTLFLTQELLVSKSIAGFSLGLFHIGGVLGRPTWGWISDKLLHGSRRKALIWVGYLLSVMAIIYSLYVTNFVSNIFLIYIFSILLGFVGLGWIGLYFTTIGELAGEESTGIATGMALLFTRAGILTSPPLFGFIADLTGSYFLSWLSLGIIILIFVVLFTYFTRK